MTYLEGMEPRFRKPGWFTKNVFNRLVALLTRLGLSVAVGGRLVLGRRREEFRATEIGEDEKPTLLRAYLEKWKWEVGAFFDGVGADASEEELRRIGPDHPAFRIDA
jgi:hypothetical protein